MGQRGPRPLPDNVRAFTGAPRKALRAADLSDGVHPEVGLPPMPHHLSPQARKEWKRITPLLLELNLLTQIDRSAIERYVRLYGRWQQVERAITAQQDQLRAEKRDPTEALTQKTPTGFMRESVLSRRASDLARQVEMAEQCFGMNPSARARVVASRNDAQYRLPGMDDEGDGGQAGFGSF
jgi:P27 family predicted phage terminase small subunit